MSVTGLQETSLRPGRLAYKRLAWAFAISLVVHALCYGGYQFSRTVLPAWLERVKFLAALAEELRKKPKTPPQPTEPPLAFIEVNPAVATPEPPKNAKFYSSQNARAANPDEIKKDSDTPQISGQRPDLSKTDEPARKFEKLQLTSPRPEPKPEEAKPKPVIGDLAMAKPDLKPRQDNGQAEEPRPRTLAEAKMRHQIPGQQRKQDGGVHRRLEMPSMDTKATITGSYDSLLYEAIAQSWYNLLDENANNIVGRSGEVVLHFKLHSDGTVTELTIDGNTTHNDLLGWLCYKAVHDVSTPAFQRWPEEMKHLENDPRAVQFVFEYY
jgi:hypothetical protein